jgi:hypothetical protein
LARHREKKVLRSGERMTSGVSEFTRLVEEFVNTPGSFSHSSSMSDSLRRQ